MEINKENAIGKIEFEPVEITVITFDTKTDVICVSGIQGEGDDFYS